MKKSDIERVAKAIAPVVNFGIKWEACSSSMKDRTRKIVRAAIRAIGAGGADTKRLDTLAAWEGSVTFIRQHDGKTLVCAELFGAGTAIEDQVMRSPRAALDRLAAMRQEKPARRTKEHDPACDRCGLSWNHGAVPCQGYKNRRTRRKP